MIRGGTFGILLGLLLFASGTIGEHSGGALLAGAFFVVMGLWVIASGIVGRIKEAHERWLDDAYMANRRPGEPLWRSGRAYHIGRSP
jgi:hypothetical protein